MSAPAAIVFAGPSLAGSAAPVPAGVELRPPAMLGDLARAARERPAAIGLIDGRFETVPAVWHKEILWVMEAGVAVYGGASMGALRAAELAPFGMRGIGAVYDAYRDGALEDDDEVAVLHGPPEAGSVPLSVAMVDIRATLEAATRDGALSAEAAVALAASAKALFYKERTWPAVLAAGGATLPGASSETFTRWLPSGRVDRKRLDAEALLAAVAAHPAGPRDSGAAPAERPRLVEEIVRRASRGAPGVAAALLDEVRLEPEAYRARSREALLTLLADEALARAGLPADQDEAIDRFRERHGLYRAAELARWLEARGLDRRRFGATVARAAAPERLAPILRPEIEEAVADMMALDPDYPARLARARRRAEDAELATRAGAAAPLPAALVEWYCRRAARPLPDSPATLARELGFGDAEALGAALAAAYRGRGDADD